MEKVYYVGADREHKGLIQLFLFLADDESEKTIMT